VSSRSGPFLPPPQQQRPPAVRRTRRWTVLLIAVQIVLVSGVFALGLAVGQALDDNPKPSTRTGVRTLRPLPLPPVRTTVTVTVKR